MLGTQGGDGRGLVEPDIGIELLRQGSVRVVAQEFCLGPVDHADEPLQARLEQAMAKRIMPSFPKIEQETGDAREVAEPLVTLPMRGTDALHLHGHAPIGRCRDRAGMRTEADQSGPSPKASRQSCPMFSSSRTTPMRASPIWELCAQTIALDWGPCASSKCPSVSNI